MTFTWPCCGQHDVGRLQIAVQKPAGMGFLERLGDLSGHAQGIGQRQCGRSCSRRCSVSPAMYSITRNSASPSSPISKILQMYGMIDRGDGHRLAAQAFARVRVGGQRGRQQLDGDLTIEPRVAGAIDLAHSAGAEGGNNLVGAKRVRRE